MKRTLLLLAATLIVICAQPAVSDAGPIIRAARCLRPRPIQRIIHRRHSGHYIRPLTLIPRIIRNRCAIRQAENRAAHSRPTFFYPNRCPNCR